MPPDPATPALAAASASTPASASGPARLPWQRIVPPWRAPLARLALAWGLLIALFWADWRDMAGQWWGSSTYNHILLVPPIIGWLVAQRVGALARLQPAAWWPGLVAFALAAALWLLGDFSGLSMARQLAVVGMAQAAVLALLGPRVAMALLFPLAYALFLVPLGDELIPLLQTVTARLTMVFLAVSQVPATIDGVFITTPAGYFEVAEACSGVKFLIAMIAYGALVANVCFRSWPRRAAFMAFALAVPVVANGLRAWGTIWIAGWYGIVFASSFDHVFYGWVFFAVVMALVMVAAWPFFDRAVDDPMADAEAIAAMPWLDRLAARTLPATPALGALAGLCALTLGWSALAARLEAPLPPVLTAPHVPGWQLVAQGPLPAWAPLHGGADRRLRLRYADAQGRTVDLSFALYAAQSEGREAGGFGQGGQPMGSAWAWEKPGPPVAGGRSEVIQAPGPVHRLTVTWYRTGALLTGSNARLKLANIADRLLLRRRTTAALIVSAADAPGAAAADSVRAFLRAAGPVAPLVDRMAGGR